MSKSTDLCRVLYPPITRADFEEAATDLGFVHYETRAGDGARRAEEQVWSLPDRTTAVNYLEDPLAGVNYLIFRGTELSRFETPFARRLQIFSTEETVELAAGAVNHNTQVEAIVRLAVTFVEYDPDAYAVFEAYATQAPTRCCARPSWMPWDTGPGLNSGVWWRASLPTTRPRLSAATPRKSCLRVGGNHQVWEK